MIRAGLAGARGDGIEPLAVDSGGVRYENPRPLRQALRKLDRWQRAQARRTPGSQELVRKHAVLGIESLNVSARPGTTVTRTPL